MDDNIIPNILVLPKCPPNHEDIGLQDIAHMQQKSRVLPNFLRILKGLTTSRSHMNRCWKHPSPFSNVHFRNTTKKFSTKLNFCYFAVYLSVSLNYGFILYFWFCSYFHSYGSFNHANSTSLSFSEFSELFTSILLLSQCTESHFALSSARSHF